MISLPMPVNSTVNMIDGDVLEFAINDSIANISGGTIKRRLSAWNGAELNVRGGMIESRIVTSRVIENIASSTVNISGGSIPYGSTIISGNQVNLFGTQFVLDGIDITASLLPGVPHIVADRNVQLGGLFVDGSQFAFNLKGTYTIRSILLLIQCLRSHSPNLATSMKTATLTAGIFSLGRETPVWATWPIGRRIMATVSWRVCRCRNQLRWQLCFSSCFCSELAK